MILGKASKRGRGNGGGVIREIHEVIAIHRTGGALGGHDDHATVEKLQLGDMRKPWVANLVANPVKCKIPHRFIGHRKSQEGSTLASRVEWGGLWAPCNWGGIVRCSLIPLH